MKKESVANGSGRSIAFVHFCEGETVTGDLASGQACSGFISKSDGTVEVQLTKMDSPVFVDVVAGIYNMYSVDIVKTGGTVPVADIMLYWQG